MAERDILDTEGTTPSLTRTHRQTIKEKNYTTTNNDRRQYTKNKRERMNQHKEMRRQTRKLDLKNKIPTTGDTQENEKNLPTHTDHTNKDLTDNDDITESDMETCLTEDEEGDKTTGTDDNKDNSNNNNYHDNNDNNTNNNTDHKTVPESDKGGSAVGGTGTQTDVTAGKEDHHKTSGDSVGKGGDRSNRGTQPRKKKPQKLHLASFQEMGKQGIEVDTDMVQVRLDEGSTPNPNGEKDGVGVEVSSGSILTFNEFGADDDNVDSNNGTSGFVGDIYKTLDGQDLQAGYGGILGTPIERQPPKDGYQWLTYVDQHMKGGDLQRTASWEDFFFRQLGDPLTDEDLVGKGNVYYHNIFSIPKDKTEWTIGYLAGHALERNLAGKDAHTFYVYSGLRTVRISSLTDPQDYKPLLEAQKFSPILVDLRRLPAGGGIKNISKKSFYLIPSEFIDIFKLEEVTQEWRDFPNVVFSHDLFSPSGKDPPRLMGKVVFDSNKGRCISLQQYTPPNPNSNQKDEKWAAVELIPWANNNFDNTVKDSFRDIRIGCTVAFDIALNFGKVVPNNVTLVTVLNGVGNERYSNQKLTRTPIMSSEDRMIPMVLSTKTLSDKKWKSIVDYTQETLPPTVVVSENQTILQQYLPTSPILNLSDFLMICLNNKKTGIPNSFDPLLEGWVNDEEKNISILFETSEVSQNITLELIRECMATEESSTLTRDRKCTVTKVFVTVPFGSMITQQNILEMCSNLHFLQKHNPYLEKTVFFEEEVFLQAYSIVNDPVEENMQLQTYQTDPSRRGLLVLSTYGQVENPVQVISTIRCPREGKEIILDLNKHTNQIVNYRFHITSVNSRLFDHLVQKHKMTIQNEFIPPFRNSNNKVKLFRQGTLNASHLQREVVDDIIREASSYDEFAMLRLEDIHGEDPSKSYFGTYMKDRSKQDQGRATLSLLLKESHNAHTTFWPIPGLLNKFWVVIDKKITPMDIKNLLTQANKILISDGRYALNTFLDFSIQGKQEYIIRPDTSYSSAYNPPQVTRQTGASVVITGWPCMVRDEQILHMFSEFGVQLDLSTDTLAWYWAIEIEGFALKIRTNHLPRARQIIQLKSDNLFGLGIHEMNNTIQTHLRVIANGVEHQGDREEKLVLKPEPPKILTETQIQSIKGKLQQPSGLSNPSQDKTILGKEGGGSQDSNRNTNSNSSSNSSSSSINSNSINRNSSSSNSNGSSSSSSSNNGSSSLRSSRVTMTEGSNSISNNGNNRSGGSNNSINSNDSINSNKSKNHHSSTYGSRDSIAINPKGSNAPTGMDTDWFEVGKGGKQYSKKTDNKEAQEIHNKTNTNNFSLLSEDREEKGDTEGEEDAGEDNEKEVQLERETIEKKDLASLARQEKKAQVTHYNAMRKVIVSRNVWAKKELRTILEAYLAPWLKLGYGVAGDALQDLLKLTDEQIRNEVALSLSGQVDEAAGEKEEERVAVTVGPTTPLTQNEEEKGEEVPPADEPLSPMETSDAIHVDQEHKEVEGGLIASQEEKEGETTGGIPQTPLTPHIEKPPEEDSSEDTLHDSEAKQSNSKTSKSNITDFFRPSLPVAGNDLR